MCEAKKKEDVAFGGNSGDVPSDCDSIKQLVILEIKVC